MEPTHSPYRLHFLTQDRRATGTRSGLRARGRAHLQAWDWLGPWRCGGPHRRGAAAPIWNPRQRAIRTVHDFPSPVPGSALADERISRRGIGWTPGDAVVPHRRGASAPIWSPWQRAVRTVHGFLSPVPGSAPRDGRISRRGIGWTSGDAVVPTAEARQRRPVALGRRRSGLCTTSCRPFRAPRSRTSASPGVGLAGPLEMRWSPTAEALQRRSGALARESCSTG